MSTLKRKFLRMWKKNIAFLLSISFSPIENWCFSSRGKMSFYWSWHGQWGKVTLKLKSSGKNRQINWHGEKRKNIVEWQVWNRGLFSFCADAVSTCRITVYKRELLHILLVGWAIDSFCNCLLYDHGNFTDLGLRPIEIRSQSFPETF